MQTRRHRSPFVNCPVSLPSSNDIRWFQRRLLNWFLTSGRSFPWRKRSANNYTKVLSEVLLQRTRAEVVANFLPSFLKRYPSWQQLAKASKKDFRKFLQPIGLWRRRSASLERLAKEMARRGGRFPRTREEIEELPNVGQYIANSILLFCHRECQPLLDVNMARVLERFFGPRKLADIRYDPYLQSLAKAVVTTKTPIVINWAILDHATLICKRHMPLCPDCPLIMKCKFAEANGLTEVALEDARP
jgi:A/G-specific adenine glycosylase